MVEFPCEKADAALRISFALRNSRFSLRSCCISSRTSNGKSSPGGVFSKLFCIHPRMVWGLTPRRSPTTVAACHAEQSWALRCSSVRRTARSLKSCGNFLPMDDDPSSN